MHIRPRGARLGVHPKDPETAEEASALAYWLWVEHGVTNGGAEGWSAAATEAREEARLERAFATDPDPGPGPETDEKGASRVATASGDSEAAALADAPSVLIGRPFAEAFEASAAADISAPAFAAHAEAYVAAVKARGDVQVLLALYRDAGKREAEVARRLKARLARSETPQLAAAAAPVRAHRDALRRALLASLERIIGSDISAADITDSVVRSRFAAVAAARALHRERAASAAFAASHAECAARAAEDAVAAAAAAEATLESARRGDDPAAEPPEPARDSEHAAPDAPGPEAPTSYKLQAPTRPTGAATLETPRGDVDADVAKTRERARRLSRLETEACAKKERVGTSAGARDRQRTLAFEKKALEAEAGRVLVRAVRAVKRMMGAATGDDAGGGSPNDEDDDFGEGAQGAAAVPRAAGAPAAPAAVDPVVVAAAEADMLLKAREASLRAEPPEKKKARGGKGPARRGAAAP